MQKMLNPREKASTNFHLILSMASHIGYKKWVPLQSGLTIQIRIGKLEPKNQSAPQALFTVMPMLISHKKPKPGTIGSVGMKHGSNLMKLRFMQVIIHKESDEIDENLNLTKLQLSARQNWLSN